MAANTCLITGGNSGIGKQAAIQLAQTGWRVIIGARNLKRGETAVNEINKYAKNQSAEVLLIDMASQASVRHASDELHKKTDKLDVLIHNAADFDIARKKPEKSAEGIETIWATNHIGPILLTNSLMQLLKNSTLGRIITIASKGLVMHPRLKVDLQDPEFKHRPFSVPKAYYQSKLAQVMYTYWLAEQLKDTPVTANCIRVTNVKVDTDRYPDISAAMKFMYKIKSRFSISPKDMAKTYTYLASSPEVSNISGKYFDEHNQTVASSAYSMKPENIDALMQLSLKYIS